jgi:hypothetical protein
LQPLPDATLRALDTSRGLPLVTGPPAGDARLASPGADVPLPWGPGLPAADPSLLWTWVGAPQTKPRAVALGDRGAQVCASVQGYDGRDWMAHVFGAAAADPAAPLSSDVLRGEDTLGDPGPFVDGARDAPVYAAAYIVDQGWVTKKYVSVYLPAEGGGRAWGDYLDIPLPGSFPSPRAGRHPRCGA